MHGSRSSLALTAALLFASCDPAKQLIVCNNTSGPVALVLETHGKEGAHRLELAPGEERNMFYGFGGWSRPARMHAADGRCLGATFEDDRDLIAVGVVAADLHLKVRRRYLLRNGLVVQIR